MTPGAIAFTVLLALFTVLPMRAQERIARRPCAECLIIADDYIRPDPVYQQMAVRMIERSDTMRGY